MKPAGVMLVSSCTIQLFVYFCKYLTVVCFCFGDVSGLSAWFGTGLVLWWFVAVSVCGL